ncbi:hypothetical protein [Fulvivirga aurantia]|uniref:hypothetical protein n=1 Tax=Fulvivirga aurantia TaxID=2529383 RepID=UPI0012BBDD59|nr:hypothetical protein [Fulvivirga aurantia]
MIKEVIQADMAMHEAQIEAWAWMNRNRPSGDHIPKDIMKGLSKGRYLTINEVRFEFFVRPVNSKTLIARMCLFFKVLKGDLLTLAGGQVFEFCSHVDERAEKIDLKIRRLDDGTIKASYKPADMETANLM